MSNQQQTGTGQIYDGDQEVAEVTYELGGAQGAMNGLLTFQDILERERVAELLEGSSLILVTADKKRLQFAVSGTIDGSTPVLSVQLTGSTKG